LLRVGAIVVKDKGSKVYPKKTNTHNKELKGKTIVPRCVGEVKHKHPKIPSLQCERKTSLDSFPSMAPINPCHFSICACHPCAGAMKIFSVSFHFYRMIPKGILESGKL